MTARPGDGLLRLLDVFGRLGIQYMIGGSGASSVHGLPRTTADIDIVAKIDGRHAPMLVSELQKDFYIDEGQVLAALEHARSFNVIHYESSYKFDIFPLTPDSYQQAQFERRRYERSALFTGEPCDLAVSSPEDAILSKLRWYRQGGEVSEQQWKDVLGVIAVQGGKLDFKYLRAWAAYLGLSLLLEQALGEAQGPQAPAKNH